MADAMTKILGIKDEITYFWSSISFTKSPFFILDILIVSLLIYWIYIFLKETRAIRILYGIILLIILFLIGKLLNLVALNYLLNALTTMFVVAIPVIFQPELRALLEKLGQADIVSDFKKMRRSDISDMVNKITSAIDKLARTKTGALIVICQKTGLKNYIDTGVILNSSISEELLISIFNTKTPLHDGAVIIKGNKIAAAACTLPLSEDKFLHIGTRHRAALGLSEQSDAIIIVVSEEKGTISVASKGILNQDIDLKKLKLLLNTIILQGRQKNK